MQAPLLSMFYYNSILLGTKIQHYYGGQLGRFYYNSILLGTKMTFDEYQKLNGFYYNSILLGTKISDVIMYALSCTF